MPLILIVKATLLWAAVLAGARLLRSAHPIDRHRFWTIGFAGVLALPLCAAALPSLKVPVESTWGRFAAPVAPAPAVPPMVTHTVLAQPQVAKASTRASVVQSTLPDAPNAPKATWPSFTAIALGIWLAGAIAAVLMVAVSWIRVHRLKGAARELDDPAWRDATDAIANRLGVRRAIRLLVHARVRVPMAGGLWSHVVYLPASIATWSAEQRDVVLAHEIAHLAGHDPLRLIAARLAVALYWFHPLAWMAARRSGADREEACDSAVLALGTRPSAYANLLLEFAHAIDAPAPLAALPIVQRSLLEQRLMAILRDERPALTRTRLLLPAIFSVVATVSIAAAQPVARPAAAGSLSIESVNTQTTSEPRMAAAPQHTSAALPVASDVAFERRQPSARRAAAGVDCADDASIGNFSGTMSTTGSHVTMQVGTSDGYRIVKQAVGDTRVCMVAAGLSDSARGERPSQWLTRSDRIVMESRKNGRTIRLTLDGPPNARQASWTVDGSQRPFDAAGQQWRDSLLALVDNIWDLSTLRGEVSTLRGEISTIHGEESTLRGEISTLRGEVSTMRGEQSTIRGEESSMQGDISSIRGHVSSLRGQISSEQGAISSLEASGVDRSGRDAAIARHNAEIERVEREIRDYDEAGKVAAIEQRIKQLDADGKVADIEAKIRAFDVNGKVAAVEQQIKDLDVDGKVAAIEKQIQALDADRRGRQLEDQRDQAARRLDAAVDRIK